ncbi:hypothetical protein J437_LFUL017152 [Ladona fulva]|uniref:Uncharacterized protein n=1 Tax=Ladona fulva TaxID=123851 RepID=A0A8K0K9L4_LADFU|nr:hypothetical protein J437_LFUL017152 [Ladona fulva]
MITQWSGWVEQSRRWVPLQEPYDSPDPPPNRELEDLVNFCKTKSWDLLVGCDSKSHHSVWGSSDVNPRGESPLEYLMTTELQLLNSSASAPMSNCKHFLSSAALPAAKQASQFPVSRLMLPLHQPEL